MLFRSQRIWKFNESLVQMRNAKQTELKHSGDVSVNCSVRSITFLNSFIGSFGTLWSVPPPMVLTTRLWFFSLTRSVLQVKRDHYLCDQYTLTFQTHSHFKHTHISNTRTFYTHTFYSLTHFIHNCIWSTRLHLNYIIRLWKSGYLCVCGLYLQTGYRNIIPTLLSSDHLPVLPSALLLWFG